MVNRKFLKGPIELDYVQIYDPTTKELVTYEDHKEVKRETLEEGLTFQKLLDSQDG